MGLEIIFKIELIKYYLIILIMLFQIGLFVFIIAVAYAGHYVEREMFDDYY